MRSESTEITRRSSLHKPGATPTKKPSPRVSLLVGASLAIAGLVAGGGFISQSAVEGRERVAATTALAESTGLHHEQLDAYSSVEKAKTHDTASVVLNEANVVIAATEDKVDASELTEVASSLASFEILPLDDVLALTAKTQAETASVTAAAAEVDRLAAAAAAEAAAAKAAADAAAAAQAAAAKAAADAAAAAQAAAAEASRIQALAGSNTPEGARATAQGMAASKYGWGADQFSCLDQLWQKESEWKFDAVNSNGGATGIPQALPGSKMATAGSDWATNATTQIAWGLEYISSSRYGTPCAAWSHSQANNWY